MVALAARVIFMLAIPPQARSVDAHSWETVANVLAGGGNPYQTTSKLNWPPLWLQLIFVISKISTTFSVPFFRVLQSFLILVESVVIILLIKLSYRQDYAGAAQWFDRAATNGNADAQYNLGVLYLKGLGVGQNDELAAQWFQKSAAQGHVEAEKELGRLYQSGKGVKQDYTVAYKWLKLAQLQGDEEAKNGLKACSAAMTPKQIAAAEKQVQEFKTAGK